MSQLLSFIRILFKIASTNEELNNHYEDPQFLREIFNIKSKQFYTWLTRLQYMPVLFVIQRICTLSSDRPFFYNSEIVFFLLLILSVKLCLTFKTTSILSYNLIKSFFMMVGGIFMTEFYLLVVTEKSIPLGVPLVYGISLFTSSISMLSLVPKCLVSCFPISYYLFRSGMIHHVIFEESWQNKLILFSVMVPNIFNYFISSQRVLEATE